MDSVQVVGPSGDVAEVEDGRLLSEPRSEFADALEAGDAFSWSSETYDYAAADTILGVQNSSEEYDLVVTRILVTGDTASQVVVHTSSGVTMGGTAVTGVNLNRSSAKVAPAVAKANETGNGQAAASYSGRVATARIAANGVTVLEDLEIVIPGGWMIGLDITTDGAAANVTIFGYFRPRTRA